MRPRRLLLGLFCAVTTACASHGGNARQPARDSLSDVGFASPENLVYDSASDVLLITNINGDPVQQDGNGFISRVSTDGKVLALKWIDGSKPDTRLDAPKGITIRADTIFVADVGGVRRFDRRTGASLGALALAGKMMNDLVFGADGTLYITDSGPNRNGSEPPDSSQDIDAIFTRVGSTATRMAVGTDLERPDGIETDGSDVVVAPLAGNELYRVTRTGERAPYVTLATGKLDGLHRLPDGSLLVTSWQGKKVYHVDNTRNVSDVVNDIESPAGVAFDPKLNTVFITSLNTNRLYWLPLSRAPARPD